MKYHKTQTFQQVKQKLRQRCPDKKCTDLQHNFVMAAVKNADCIDQNGGYIVGNLQIL